MEYKSKMTNTTITVIKDFHEKPYGRYRDDADGCDLTSGQTFREDILVPALEKFDHVVVDLTGYNRYGRSFLDEAFGGLIREAGLTSSFLEKKLTFKHDLVGRVVDVIDERIAAAKRDCEN
jgi:hypothetical protein